MLPWELAKQWQEEHSTEDFWDLLGRHMSGGFVWITPQVFLLASEERWNAEKQEIAINDGSPANAWFVRLAASAGHANPVGEFLRVAPHRHQYALWCRRGEMRVRAFDWEKLIKKVGGQ
jgi:hypothetical protein